MKVKTEDNKEGSSSDRILEMSSVKFVTLAREQGSVSEENSLSFWRKMLNWKLLGDLLPSELKLECERAGIEVSPKGSHNVIKLSKYILSNGYDPESFYFNTHYQADKSHPLLGMTSAVTGPAKMYNDHARVSSSAAVTTSTTSAARPIASAPLMHNNPGLSSTSQTLRSDDKLLEMFERMSLGVEKMVALLEAKKGDSLGVDRSSCTLLGLT